MKKLQLLLALLLIVATSSAFVIIKSPKAAADSSNISLSLGTGCVSYVDGGTGSTYTDVAYGSNVSVTVTNNDDVVTQKIVGGSINTSVAPNTKTTNNVTTFTLSSVTHAVTLSFTPVPKNGDPAVDVGLCPIGSTPVTSSIVINPATASLTCKVSGSTWVFGGTFSGSSLGTGIYNGSTKAASLQPGTISQSVNAQSTQQAFNIIDGANYGGKGTVLASATCPAYVAATTLPTPKTAAATTTTTPAATTATPASTTTAGDPVTITEVKVGATEVSTTKPIQVESGQPLVIQGSTVASGVVTLTIHSTPRVVTVTADKNGHWSYTVTDLPAGNHTVQAAVKDPATGQTSPTSQILAFTVASATVAVKKPVAASRSWLPYVIAAVLLLLAAAVVIALIKLMKKKSISAPDATTSIASPAAPTDTVPVSPTEPQAEEAAAATPETTTTQPEAVQQPETNSGDQSEADVQPEPSEQLQASEPTEPQPKDEPKTE